MHMPFSMMLSTSTDKRYCGLETPDQQADLTSDDMEKLITRLGQQRASMLPAVAPPEIQPEDETPVDAISPRTDLGLLRETQALVILSIAFPGLGIRVVTLTQPEALALGNKLIRYASA
jgi:hypothetical protein